MDAPRVRAQVESNAQAIRERASGTRRGSPETALAMAANSLGESGQGNFQIQTAPRQDAKLAVSRGRLFQWNGNIGAARRFRCGESRHSCPIRPAWARNSISRYERMEAVADHLLVPRPPPDTSSTTPPKARSRRSVLPNTK